MPDKEQCVYNLYGQPRLTSYTSPLELGTFPLLTLLALCVCVYVFVYIRGLVYVNKTQKEFFGFVSCLGSPAPR